MKGKLWGMVFCALLVASFILTACNPVAAQEPVKPTEAVKQAEPTNAPEPTQEPVLEPTQAPEPANTGADCPDGVVTVSAHDWSAADRQEYWDQVIQAFNDAHPCIVAESVRIQDDRAVRLSEIAAGTAPDLVGFDSSDLPRVYMMEGLMDLTPFLDSDVDFNPEEQFFESVWKTGFVDGKPLAIAKDYSVSAFYANVELFEKAGIELPKEGWTYDDYLQIAQQLTIDENGNNATSPDFDPSKVVQWGASTPYWSGDTGWWRGFQSVLYSFGAHTISDDGMKTTGYINSETAVKAWEWYRDLIHKHHVAPDATYLAASNFNHTDMFSGGQLAIAGSFWGPWYQDTFNAAPDLKWAAISLPTGPGGHKAAIMWMGWGINANSKNPKAAWELLKWLTTEPGQRVFALKALTGDAKVAAELQQEKDPYWGIFLGEVPHQDRLDDGTTPFYTTCVDTPASQLMGRLFQESGATLDIQAELDELAAEADRCLAESMVE
jgi:multiple sugar transport system substrate-binding protein